MLDVTKTKKSQQGERQHVSAVQRSLVEALRRSSQESTRAIAALIDDGGRRLDDARAE